MINRRITMKTSLLIIQTEQNTPLQDFPQIEESFAEGELVFERERLLFEIQQKMKGLSSSLDLMKT
jgi:hypothetical protein